VVVEEHRDRLMRFGFESVEAVLAAQGRKIVVIEKEETADEMPYEWAKGQGAVDRGTSAATNRRG
jgi:predicted site-specific integrase-resolvase